MTLKNHENRLVWFTNSGVEPRAFHRGQFLDFALFAHVGSCSTLREPRRQLQRSGAVYDVKAHIETVTIRETEEADLWVTVFDFGENAFTTEAIWHRGVEPHAYWFSATIALEAHERQAGFTTIIPAYESLFHTWKIQAIYRREENRLAKKDDISPLPMYAGLFVEVPEILLGGQWNMLDDQLRPIPDALTAECLLECHRVK